MPRHFSIDTLRHAEIGPEVRLIAKATRWLCRQRTTDGIWGGEDAVDRLVSTTHAAMALMAAGFPPTSRTVEPALGYLAKIDSERNLSFFWRSGALLNLPTYSDVVEHDVEYMWKYRKRIGVHRDYPVPFFLLKVLRFASPPLKASVAADDVVQWILEEWNDKDCWYGRASITSMALALLFDMTFPARSEITKRALNFIVDSLRTENGRATVSGNVVEDAFVLFNCEERGLAEQAGCVDLRPVLDALGESIAAQAQAGGWWQCAAPFGGAVGDSIYPTAVCTRALLAHVGRRDDAMSQLAIALLEEDELQVVPSAVRRAPFWGAALEEDAAPFCFVLMPFDRKLTAIYNRYVKAPLGSELGLGCVRADDLFGSSSIMHDIWTHMNRAALVIADLTGRNPNVFYELGMAHVLGKRVVLLAQSMDAVPFDLRALRVLIYEDGPEGYEHLARTIVEYAKTELMSVGFTVTGSPPTLSRH